MRASQVSSATFSDFQHLKRYSHSCINIDVFTEHTLYDNCEFLEINHSKEIGHCREMSYIFYDVPILLFRGPSLTINIYIYNIQ